MTIPTINRIAAHCPGCKNEILFYRNPRLGEFVTCPKCGDLVEVVSLSPLTLDWSADIDDDDEEWPDYRDDYYYDEDLADIGDFTEYED